MKCNKCNAEWQVDASRSASIKICPFCQEKIAAEKSGEWKYCDNTKELLEYVAAEYGNDALFGRKHFSDHTAPLMPQGQKNLLKQAFECGAVKILQDNMTADQAHKEIAVKQAVGKLIDHYRTGREDAEQVIWEFTNAIGWGMQKPTPASIPVSDDFPSGAPPNEPVTNEPDFKFEDISNLGKISIQNLIREINPHDLVVCLKNTTDEIKDAFLLNMSKRRSEQTREDIEYLREITPYDVSVSQKNIINKAIELGIFQSAQPSGKPPAAKESGNTVGNIAGGRGLVAQKGDWLYYCNDYELYKMRADGNDNNKLVDDDCTYLNIADDWIYYCNEIDSKIYKIRMNGSGKTKVSEDKSSYINILGDWIFYCNGKTSGNIYKIKTDGSGRTKLNDDESSCVNVADDWIFYVNKSDGYKIYKIKTDGSDKTKITDDKSGYINFSDNWLFYQNISDSTKIYKIKTDGSDKTKLNYDESVYINVAGDWVFFSNKNDGGKLYKIQTDGSNEIKLGNDQNVLNINIADDWIFYRKGNESKFYKIRADGTNRQIVDTIIAEPNIPASDNNANIDDSIIMPFNGHKKDPPDKKTLWGRMSASDGINAEAIASNLFFWGITLTLAIVAGVAIFSYVDYLIYEILLSENLNIEVLYWNNFENTLASISIIYPSIIFAPYLMFAAGILKTIYYNNKAIKQYDILWHHCISSAFGCVLGHVLMAAIIIGLLLAVYITTPILKIVIPPDILGLLIPAIFASGIFYWCLRIFIKPKFSGFIALTLMIILGFGVFMGWFDYVLDTLPVIPMYE